MPAGIAVYNDAGYLQIDETYKNLALRQKGTATTTAAYGAGSQVTLTFANCVNPMLFFRSSEYVSNPTITVSGSTFSYQVIVSGPIGTSFDYYLFDEPVFQNLKAGFEVYNSSGQIIYEAGQKYLRVVGRQGGGGNETPVDVVYNTAKAYAFGCTFQGFSGVITPGGPNGVPPRLLHLYFLMALSIAGGARVNMREMSSSTTTDPPGAYNSYVGQMLMIDVTNY